MCKVCNHRHEYPQSVTTDTSVPKVSRSRVSGHAPQAQDVVSRTKLNKRYMHSPPSGRKKHGQAPPAEQNDTQRIATAVRTHPVCPPARPGRVSPPLPLLPFPPLHPSQRRHCLRRKGQWRISPRRRQKPALLLLRNVCDWLLHVRRLCCRTSRW